MEYVTWNDDVTMPILGIGTFQLSPDETECSVLHALQCGYRLIDTANAYVNEKAVGRAMKQSGVPRNEIFLETKLCSYTGKLERFQFFPGNDRKLQFRS